MYSTNRHSEWLNTLGGRRADLPPCVRGLSITHTLTYPGDVTDATLVGSVKVAPDAPSELAVFSVGTPIFADEVTTWAFSLAAGSGVNSTGSLPADADGYGVAVFVYDLLLTLSGGSPQRIAAGLFPVSGFVTEIA